MVEHLEFGYFDVLSIPFQCFKAPSFRKFKTPRCAGHASKDASRKYHLVRYVLPCLYRLRWPSWLRRLRTRAFPRSLSHCATAYILYRVIATPVPLGRTSRCPPRCRSGARPWSDRRASPQASSRPHLQPIEHAIDGEPVDQLEVADHLVVLRDHRDHGEEAHAQFDLRAVDVFHRVGVAFEEAPHVLVMLSAARPRNAERPTRRPRSARPSRRPSPRLRPPICDSTSCNHPYQIQRNVQKRQKPCDHSPGNPGHPVFMLCEGRFHSSSSISRIGLSSQLSSRSAHLGQRSSQLTLS